MLVMNAQWPACSPWTCSNIHTGPTVQSRPPQVYVAQITPGMACAVAPPGREPAGAAAAPLRRLAAPGADANMEPPLLGPAVPLVMPVSSTGTDPIDAAPLSRALACISSIHVRDTNISLAYACAHAHAVSMSPCFPSRCAAREVHPDPACVPTCLHVSVPSTVCAQPSCHSCSAKCTCISVCLVLSRTH